MEELLNCPLNNHESVEKLKQHLLCITLELESVKTNANVEIYKYEETIKHLINLLRIAYQERNEAIYQVQNLLNNLVPSSPSNLYTIPPHVQTEGLPALPAKANISTSESNSLSETSPVGLYFEAVSSPDFSNINMPESGNMGFVNQSFVQENNGFMSTGSKISRGMIDDDGSNAVIDKLVEDKTLPQKGKLLQSVIEAGPLLGTLLATGPLPQWQTPPPLQPLESLVPISGCEAPIINNNEDANPRRVVQKPGSSQGNGKLLNSVASINSRNLIGKQQRFR